MKKAKLCESNEPSCMKGLLLTFDVTWWFSRTLMHFELEICLLQLSWFTMLLYTWWGSLFGFMPCKEFNFEARSASFWKYNAIQSINKVKLWGGGFFTLWPWESYSRSRARKNFGQCIFWNTDFPLKRPLQTGKGFFPSLTHEAKKLSSTYPFTTIPVSTTFLWRWHTVPFCFVLWVSTRSLRAFSMEQCYLGTRWDLFDYLKILLFVFIPNFFLKKC